MSAIAGAVETLKVLQQVDTGSIKWELEKLEAIQAWALQVIGCDFKVGDRVRIKDGYEVNAQTAPGWWHKRECLAGGATATVRRIDFNPFHGGHWYAEIVLDREWSVSEWGSEERRYWNGPVDETPEGMQPPSKYDQEHNPEGRKHTFAFRLENLESAA